MVKLCIPVTGATMEEVEEQLEELAVLDFDMIEWRADYYFSMDIPKRIKDRFPDKELLFTFRTRQEGGEAQPEAEHLMYLYHLAGMSGKVDIMDLELEGICASNPEIIDKLKSYGVQLMISNHDFEKTPQKEDLVDKYKQMQEIGGDIGKIAVMPQNMEDVETLVSAAKEASQQLDIPIVAISMGELGVKTRIEGETFGSIITFGALEKASAPGQIPAKELKDLLKNRTGLNQI